MGSQNSNLAPHRPSVKKQFSDFAHSPGEIGVAITAGVILAGAVYAQGAGSGVQSLFISANANSVYKENVSDKFNGEIGQVVPGSVLDSEDRVAAAISDAMRQYSLDEPATDSQGAEIMASGEAAVDARGDGVSRGDNSSTRDTLPLDAGDLGNSPDGSSLVGSTPDAADPQSSTTPLMPERRIGADIPAAAPADSPTAAPEPTKGNDDNQDRDGQGVPTGGGLGGTPSPRGEDHGEEPADPDTPPAASPKPAVPAKPTPGSVPRQGGAGTPKPARPITGDPTGGGAGAVTPHAGITNGATPLGGKPAHRATPSGYTPGVTPMPQAGTSGMVMPQRKVQSDTTFLDSRKIDTTTTGHGANDLLPPSRPGV